MAGQVIKRSEDTWTVRIFVGRDLNGKRKYFNKTVHGKKKDADKYLIAKLRDKDLGIFVEPASMPLNEHLDKWLQNTAKPRLRESTFHSYSDVLKLYIRPKLGMKLLCDLEPYDIQTDLSRYEQFGTFASNRSLCAYSFFIRPEKRCSIKNAYSESL